MENQKIGSRSEIPNQPELPFDQETYNALLKRFGAVFGLPDDVMAAYSTEAIAEFSFGLPSYDEHIKTEAGQVRSLCLTTTLNNYRQAYEAEPATARNIARAANRRERRLATSKQIRRSVSREVINMASHQNWLTLLADRAREGIVATGALGIVMEGMDLNYYAKFEGSFEPETMVDDNYGNVTKTDLLTLFSADQVEQGISVQQLTMRLREQGNIDLGKETLDARFAAAVAVCQVEVVRFLVDNTFEIGYVLHGTPATRQAVLQLLTKHMARFGQSSLEELAGMVHEQGKVIEHYIGADKHLDTPLRLVSKATTTVREQLSYLMHGFSEIYDKLGYELPDFLKEIMPDPADSSKIPPATSPVQESLGESLGTTATQDTTEAADWAAIVEDVLHDISAVEQPYRYTSDRIRKFENGPAFVRELATDLADKGLLDDIATVQSLAMLTLQSQREAGDKSAYFAELLERKNKLENLIEDLYEAGAGKKHRSSLLNALYWLDEVAESGADRLIANDRLQTLIYDYCIGPEIVTEPPETAAIPVSIETIAPQDELTTEVVEIPISERSIEAAQRAKLQADRKKAQEIYGDVLSEILATEVIEYVDVMAASNTAVNRRTYRATGRRQENAQYADIDVERLQGLLGLRDRLEEQGKSTQLKFIRAAQNQSFPPFVLYVEQTGRSGGVCLMENPVVGYASRIYPNTNELGVDWRELIRLSARELSELAIAVQTKIHKPKGSPTFDQHYNLDLLSRINLALADTKRY